MNAPVVAVGLAPWDFGCSRRRVPRKLGAAVWVHKTANILDALPKGLHKSAKAALHETY